MKDNSISHLFSTPVAIKKLNIPISKLRKACIEKKGGRIQSNAGGYHSETLDIHTEPFKSLFDIIHKEVSEYAFNFLEAKKVEYDNSWYMVNRPYSYNLKHDHPYASISGVFYVTKPKNSGDIVFHNPHRVQHFLPNDSVEKFNNYNAGKYFFHAKEKDLLIFPAWLEHEVTQNLSKKNRIAISFNYKC